MDPWQVYGRPFHTPHKNYSLQIFFTSQWCQCFYDVTLLQNISIFNKTHTAHFANCFETHIFMLIFFHKTYITFQFFNDKIITEHLAFRALDDDNIIHLHQVSFSRFLYSVQRREYQDVPRCCHYIDSIWNIIFLLQCVTIWITQSFWMTGAGIQCNRLLSFSHHVCFSSYAV